MKRLLLLTLAAIPLFAYSVNFVYCDYDYYEDDYWYDEYWEDDYWCDGYWVYYPHGYYCVYSVWWYPWWWDFFWWRCHWCHHFSWDFFYCGFYIVWYDGGCWWFRPRYGRWVRYRLPYSYSQIWRNANSHGVYLPKKPPREIDIPYKGERVMELAQQRDPELFARVQKEHETGKLEKMRSNYMNDMKKEITRKNQEYRIKNNDVKHPSSLKQNKQGNSIRSRQTPTTESTKQLPQYQTTKKQSQKAPQSHIRKQEKKSSNKVESRSKAATRMKEEGKKKPVPQDYYKEPPNDKEGKRRDDYRGESPKNREEKQHVEPRDRRMMSSRSSRSKG